MDWVLRQANNASIVTKASVLLHGMVLAVPTPCAGPEALLAHVPRADGWVHPMGLSS